MANIAEILKNAPRGLKLYSPLCGECELDKVKDGSIIVDNDTDSWVFSHDGRFDVNGEMLLFPSREVRDWEAFEKALLKPEDKHSDYVDLGLPSGTLWKSTNEDDFFTFDGAVEKFGDNMPTKEQWEELKNNCTWQWEGNGYTVKGKNGKQIFLLAAGRRYGTSLYDAGGYGYYWSSSLDTDYPGDAWGFSFDSGTQGMDDNDRNGGFSVRLVKTKGGNK